MGTITTQYNVNADNMGKVFAKKTTVKTPIVAGSGAILDLSAACKGAAGDVTISPDASGGMNHVRLPRSPEPEPRQLPVRRPDLRPEDRRHSDGDADGRAVQHVG